MQLTLHCESPSLRGSGLKSYTFDGGGDESWVSLFTREWIEIVWNTCKTNLYSVSLFTREWIEIFTSVGTMKWYTFVSLFTREWIEITSNAKTKDGGRRLPLYEGVDWNLWVVKKRLYGAIVSLFTREWIEIIRLTAFFPAVFSLPLYEGVDWNFHKSLWISVQVLVSLFTREWIEIPVSWFAIRSNKSPSLRGSGLKSKNAPVLYNVFWSLPLYEGVDWNVLVERVVTNDVSSPSLRGSGLK